MKKILLIVNIVLLLSPLCGCSFDSTIDESLSDLTTTVDPITNDPALTTMINDEIVFYYANDKNYRCQLNMTYNPKTGIMAMIGNRILNRSIVYDVTDIFTNETVNIIDTSFPSTYKVVCSVNDEVSGKTGSAEFKIKVGCGVPVDFYKEIDSWRDDYQLVWSDEFDADGAPDSSIWSYDLGTGINGWGNNEEQTYTKSLDNVYVEDGVLNIVALREENGRYTSARIKTLNKQHFRYGYIEALMKLPSGAGTWPAFWMLSGNSINGGWPDMGEIDIMEHSGNRSGTVNGTIHTSVYNGRKGTQRGGGVRVNDATSTYHRYGIEWTPSYIKFYVDSSEYFTYSTPSTPGTYDYQKWPFDQPFYIILNLALGGNYGGALNDSIFSNPVVYKIDYVRVYQSEKINEVYNS